MTVKASSRDAPLAALIPGNSDPLAAPRVVSATADGGAATEDGGAVVLSVLSNDTGVVGIVQINGVSVTPGSVITLVSGAQILVNANGVLSFLVNGAYQNLAAGQTATESFTYVATDGGASWIAPDGAFAAGAMTATHGFSIIGAAAGDLSGYAVSGIGDVNGDGRNDILIGALQADPGGRINAGTSYVIYGRAGGYASPIDLASLSTANGFAINGVVAVDYSGAAIDGIGDVNGDGRADFVIGAPWADSAAGANAGAAYVVFGRAAGGFSGPLDLSSLNGSTGFVLRGAGAGDGLGFAVSAAGDLNNDGIADLVVGAREADPGGRASAGKAYVLFGHTGAFSASFDAASLNGSNGFSLSGIDAGDVAGISVASAGDLNNDGIADLIIGAAGGDPGARAAAGEAYVLFGHAGGFAANIDLASLNGTNGFIINGANAADNAGWSVASAGDLNADGIDDVAISALYADPAGRTSAGSVYILYGRSGGFGASVNLSSLTGATGFVITGSAAGNLTGHTVASAGDVNADGIDDLLIGALYADGAGGADSGETYLVFGKAGGFGASLDLTSLNGVNGFLVGGGALGGFSGQAVSAVGDVNGDGVADLLIGSPSADPNGRTDAGVSYLLYGGANIARLTAPTTVTVTITGANDAPTIVSGGGGANAVASRVENGTSVATITAVDIDNGAVVTYSIAGGADAARFKINAATGLLEFKVAPNFESPTDVGGNNVYDVTVRASDGTLFDTQALVVTVTNLNEAPVITSNGGGATANRSLAENLTTVTTNLANDSDGTTPTWSIVGGADAAAFLINTTTGALRFAAAPNFEAPGDANADNAYEVIVQASDGTLVDTQALTVTVTNANEAPVITSGGGAGSAAYDVVEGTTGSLANTAVDPDAGSTLTWAIIGGADQAFFVIGASTGVLDFVTPPDFATPLDSGGNNIYQVQIRVSDGARTDTQTINVRVVDTNSAPVITSLGGGPTGAYAIFEGTTGPTIISATDPDGTTPTYSIIGGADAAFFTINGATGLLELAAARDFETPADANADNVYEVIVRAFDGTFSDTQTVSLTILNTNEAPVITSGGGGPTAVVSTTEDTTTVTTVAAGDQDAGASLAFSIVGGADQALFTINATTGQLGFVSGRDFEAPSDVGGDNVYDLTVQVSDGTLTDTQAIAVTVTDLPDGPVITSDGGGPTASLSRAENGTAVTTVTANDPSALPLTYSITGGFDQARFTIDNTTGVLSFVAPPNFEAPTDSNSDNSYQVVVQASNGTFTDSQVINVAVTNLNEAPVIVSNGGGAVGGYTISENTLGPNSIVAVDPDTGAAITYSIIGGADAARFVINVAGVIQLAANPNFESPADANADNVYELIVQASDGTLTDTQTINLTVTNQNEAPVITSNGGGSNAAKSVLENTTAVTTVTATDPDGVATPLTFSIVGGTDQGLFTINATTGALAFVSARDFEAPSDSNSDGVYNVVVQASDGTNTDVQAINVTVTNRNEAPVITSNGGGASANITRAENGAPFVTTVGAIDPDAGAVITYSISGGADAARFTINATTGALNFVTPPDFEAPTDSNGDNRYIVLVRASDGQLADVQTLNVFVTDASEASPVITSNGGGPTAVASVTEGAAAVTTVTATDLDGPGAPIFSIVGGIDAALFTINATTGALSFVSGRDFEVPTDSGLDNIYDVIVQASDGILTDTQAIAVAVTNLNEAPAITSSGGGPTATISVTENMNPPDVTILTAADPDAGASFTYSIIGGADAGAFVVNTLTGSLQFASPRDFEAPGDAGGDNVYDVVVQVSDGTLTDTQAIAVTVTNLAEPAVIGGLVASISRFEAEAATAIDTDVTVTDGGLGYAGGDLVVTGMVATDELSVLNIGVAPGQIGVAGSTVTFGGVSFGTITSSPGAFLVSFNASATLAAVEALVEALAYRSTSDIPVAAHGLTITITNTANDTSAPATVTVNFVADQLFGTAGADTLNGLNGDDVIQGLGGDDILIGDDGFDDLIGGDGDDNLNGGFADDDLTGGLGSDTIDGGSGIDSAIFAGDSVDYFIVELAGGGVQVIDDSSGDTDTLTNVEFLVFDDQTVDVSQLIFNTPPTITSDGGGSTALIGVFENTAGVTTVQATDPDPGAIRYVISGGADAAFFTIDRVTGVLSFISAPDFEAPADADLDNFYEVTVLAIDGQSNDAQQITVEVINTAGAPLAPKGDGEPMNSPTFVPSLESEIPTGAEAGWFL